MGQRIIQIHGRKQGNGVWKRSEQGGAATMAGLYYIYYIVAVGLIVGGIVGWQGLNQTFVIVRGVRKSACPVWALTRI